MRALLGDNLLLPSHEGVQLDDVADRVATSGDECFLCDITDALEFWGIPYERGSHPPVRCLAATEKDEKSEKIGYAPCKTHGALS